MSFYVDHHKVRVITGPKTQTVNVYVDNKRPGLYDPIIRILGPENFVEEEQLERERFSSIAALTEYLVANHGACNEGSNQGEHWARKVRKEAISVDKSAVCEIIPDIEKAMNKSVDGFITGVTTQNRRITVLLSYHLENVFFEIIQELGFSTLWAENRIEFIETVRKHDFDIALEWQHEPTDYSVRDILRQCEKNVPVVLCLNWNRQRISDFDELGYADCLKIPFKVDELQTKLRDIVRRHGESLSR